MSTPNPGTSVPQIPTLGRQEADGDKTIQFGDLGVGETFHVGSTLYEKTNDVQLPDFGWVNAFRVEDDRPIMFYDDAIVERGA